MNGRAPLRYPPEHWRRQAEEARAKAKRLRYPEARHEMERIAALYDRLAEWAERFHRTRGEGRGDGREGEGEQLDS
jgi:hypothetical protein